MAAAAHGPPQAAGHGAAPPPENDVGDAQDGWEQAAPTLVGVSCRADFHVLRSMWRPRDRRLRPEPHTSAPDGRAWGETTPLVPSDVSQLALEQRMREMPAVQTALAHDKLLLRIPAMLEAMFVHARLPTFICNGRHQQQQQAPRPVQHRTRGTLTCSAAPHSAVSGVRRPPATDGRGGAAAGWTGALCSGALSQSPAATTCQTHRWCVTTRRVQCFWPRHFAPAQRTRRRRR